MATAASALKWIVYAFVSASILKLLLIQRVEEFMTMVEEEFHQNLYDAENKS